MASLNDFNPYAILAEQASAANLAKPAKVNLSANNTLASLAALAIDSANGFLHGGEFFKNYNYDDWQEFYHERAAIAEYDGGLSRADAEAQAIVYLRSVSIAPMGF